MPLWLGRRVLPAGMYAGQVQSSPSTVTFYKVKSHSGIIGNEGADHLAHKAAVNQITDISLQLATDPFYNLFWLSVPNKVGSHAEELRVLTNLQDKLKHHMHANHYLGEANTDTLLYKLWQKLQRGLSEVWVCFSEVPEYVFRAG